MLQKLNLLQLNFNQATSLMDLNRFSYYRANPYANNDFIPVASMANRKKK